MTCVLEDHVAIKCEIEILSSTPELCSLECVKYSSKHKKFHFFFSFNRVGTSFSKIPEI
jgi:hypothetical protein